MLVHLANVHILPDRATILIPTCKVRCFYKSIYSVIKHAVHQLSTVQIMVVHVDIVKLSLF